MRFVEGEPRPGTFPAIENTGPQAEITLLGKATAETAALTITSLAEALNYITKSLGQLEDTTGHGQNVSDIKSTIGRTINCG